MVWRWLLVWAAVSSASAADLAIRQAAIERYEDGPPVFRSEPFVAGEAVHFSFFVDGFTRKSNEVNVAYRAVAHDPAGLLLAPEITGQEQTTLSPEDKEWRPKLRGSFLLPTILLPGDYSVEVKLEDKLTGNTAATVLPFEVAGPHIRPVSAVSIQNLDFYRNDTDEKPLESAAFRPGEEIHVRFLVVGYRHDAQGAIRVSYGIALQDAAGKTLFENPSAAQDAGAELYPKPYVPGIFSFSLKPDTPPGEFTLTVTATDAVGTQSVTARRNFRLE